MKDGTSPMKLNDVFYVLTACSFPKLTMDTVKITFHYDSPPGLPIQVSTKSYPMIGACFGNLSVPIHDTSLNDILSVSWWTDFFVNSIVAGFPRL